jgi:hypothetical protein
MSELHIGLVAEGDTDQIVIEAALKAILARAFVLTRLPAEATRGAHGGGWCGVFKWCKEFRALGHAGLAQDPTLELFDLVIVHLDGDVADKTYADCGPAADQQAADLAGLPCAMPCPPPSDTVAALRLVLLTWLGVSREDAKTLFCIPSKSIESWLAAALLPGSHPLLSGIECRSSAVLTCQLAQLPKAGRIRAKSAPVYRSHAGAVTTRWGDIRSVCSQAAVFQDAVVAARLYESSTT